MRFMVMVKATPADEASGLQPTTEEFAAMGRFNEELVKAGVMLAGEGLHPSKQGALVQFEGGKPRVIDGPFTEAKELIAGYWLWQCPSLAEAIEWAGQIPFDSGAVEIRQVYEAEEFGPEFTPALRAQEERQRAQLARNQG